MTSGPLPSSSRDDTGLPSGSLSVNSGAASPAFFARCACALSINSAVARCIRSSTSRVGLRGNRPDSKSDLKASRWSCRAMEVSVDWVGPPHLVHLPEKGYMANVDMIYLEYK